MDIEQFHKHVMDFYGSHGVYSMNANIDVIRAATDVVINQYGEDAFCADSVDRERVRDVLIDDFGCIWPN